MGRLLAAVASGALVASGMACARPSAIGGDAGAVDAAPTTAALTADAATADAHASAVDAGASDPDRAAIARALCGAAPVASDRGAPSCACPAFTELHGSAGQTFAVKALYPGSYTGPDRTEIAVGTSGCETGAGTAFSFEGLALLRRTLRGFERLTYDRGPFGECTPIVSGARVTRLVCHAFSGHGGLYRHAYALVSYDEAGNGARATTQEILSFSTNLLDSAASDAGFRGKLRVLEPTRFDVAGKDRFAAGDDRALAVAIDVDARLVCAGAPPGCTPERTTIPLRFVFDGAKLVLAPGSRRALADLRSRDADQP